MMNLTKAFLGLFLLAAAGFAQESKIPQAVYRELYPLTSTRVEKIFYMNMDRIKIPTPEEELEAGILLHRMSECDRNQGGDRGGTINQAVEGEGWNPQRKIRLAENESNYRKLLDEICRQEDLYWWIEDNPWIGVMVGPKSTYQEHARRPALQSPAPDDPKIRLASSWWVPVSKLKSTGQDLKSQSELLGIPPNEKSGSGIRIYNIRYVLDFYPEDKKSSFKARIWEKMFHSWPGNNSQIIEIVKDGKRLSSKEVGGQPIMKDVWGTVWDGGRFIYIHCRNRGYNNPTSIYAYRVKDDFTVEEAGIVVPKEELEKYKDEAFRDWKRYPLAP